MARTANARSITMSKPRQNAGLNKDFVRRVLGKRKAGAVERLLDEVDLEVQRRIREAEEFAFGEMKIEALTALARLPDFAAMKRLPGGDDAFRAIRGVADKYGFAMAAIVSQSREPAVSAARIEAVRAVCDACPKLTDRVIGMLFAGMSASRVKNIRWGRE